MTTATLTITDRASADSNWTREAAQRLEELNLQAFVTLAPVVSFIVLLIFVGVQGNLLVSLVYLKQFQPSATRVFVLSLAACDLLTNVFSLPRLVARARLSYNPPGPHYCRVGIVAMFPILMSYGILGCVAFDRRRRICQPLQRQLNARQATYVLLVPLTLTSVLIFPFVPYYGDHPRETGVRGLTGTRCGFVSLDTRRNFCIAVTTFFVLIFSLATFAYARILAQVWRIKKGQLAFARAKADTGSPGGPRQEEVKGKSLETVASQDSPPEDVVLTDVRRVEESANFSVPNESFTGLERPTETCPQREQDHDAQRGTDNSDFRLADKNQSREDQKAKDEAQHGHLKRMVFSKTTLMMLVLTVTTIVFCSPEIAVRAAKLEYVGQDLSSWDMNLRFLSVVLPTVNSVINPFIYSFCNPKFRRQCRRFLANVRGRVRAKMANCCSCWSLEGNVSQHRCRLPH